MIIKFLFYVKSSQIARARSEAVWFHIQIHLLTRYSALKSFKTNKILLGSLI